MIILQSPFPVQGYSAEALAFFARLGTQPSDARKTIYDRLISGLVYSGVWAKLDALYILAAADAPTALTNLKQSSFGASAVGSPTFAADGGYTGTNAITKYLESGFDPTVGSPNFVRDSNSIFAWKSTNPSGDQGMLVALSDERNYVQAYRIDGKFYYQANGAASSLNAASNTGLFEVTRTTNLIVQPFLAGIKAGSNISGASTALAATKTVRLVGDGLNYGATAQVSAGGFGAGLTAPDSRNLFAYINNYLTDLAGGARPVQLLFSSDVVNDGLGNYTPGLARLADGRLLAVYCVGTNQTNGKIVYKLSSDNGKTWAAAVDIAIPPGGQTYTDIGLCVTSAGTIIISFMQELNDFSTNAVKVIRGTVAGDLSISWGSVISVPGTNLATSSHALQLANGTLMLGLYHYPSVTRTSVIFSTDDGVTWSGETDVATVLVAGDEWTESNYVQASNGTIYGVIRNDNGTTASRTGYWLTSSTDNGATWTTPVQIFNDTIAAAPSRPALAIGPTEKLFLLTRFNGSDTNQTSYTYSSDNGATWSSPALYYNISTFTYGQHVSAQVFYDSATQTVMSIMGLGNFTAAQITFQQFYLP